MNHLENEILKKANEEAIYNLYLYLVHKSIHLENEPLHSIVHSLEQASKEKPYDWKSKELFRLQILINAVNADFNLANSRIQDHTYSKSGLTACTFAKPNGNISVIFKGTGSGEWIDNGEGLSGIAEENTYMTFSPAGETIYSQTIIKDYATDQQAEALNWFRSIAAKNAWNADTQITVSGHSKGGNKAQFVAMHSNLINECYSFDGQGFSPEALCALEKQYGKAYETHRQRIYSFSAENDYVNVLGKRLVPENNIYYFKSGAGIHHMEAILDNKGKIRPQCEQGKLSAYAEKLSNDLMNMNPLLRQYATLGIMNIFQKYLGEGIPVNGDWVSAEKTIAGIAVAVSSFLRNLPKFN